MSVKEWQGFQATNPRPDLNPPYVNLLTRARPGWTLIRTIMDLHLTWHQSSAQIPPDPIVPLYAALYQWTNVAGENPPPIGIDDTDREWLWYQQLDQREASGTASGTQIDINWMWDLHVDSEARRKIEVDQPSLTLVMNGHQGADGGVPTAYPAPRWWYVIRQLWQHE
jgi:hypothetical protein